MHIHIDSKDRHSGTATEFSINLQSISGALTRGLENSVGVKHAIIPYTFYQIRTGLNNAILATFTDASTIVMYLAELPSQATQLASNYSGNPSLANVVTNLQTQLNTNTAGQVFTVSQDIVNGTINISVASGTFSLTQIDPKVFSILGLVGNSIGSITINGIQSIQSTQVVDLTPLKYLYIKTNIPMKDGFDYDSYTENTSGIIARVPLAGGNINQFVNVNYEPFNIGMRDCGHINNLVTFSLYDDMDQLVNMNGADWNFTLLLENRRYSGR